MSSSWTGIAAIAVIGVVLAGCSSGIRTQEENARASVSAATSGTQRETAEAPTVIRLGAGDEIGEAVYAHHLASARMDELAESLTRAEEGSGSTP